MTGDEVERRQAAFNFEFFVALFGAAQQQAWIARRIAEVILKERPVEKMIEEMADGVHEFQRDIVKCDQPLSTGTRQLQGGRRTFKLGHLREELIELTDSVDVEEEVDALVDMIYVALGWLLEMGVHPMTAFRVVHEANMRKEHGGNGAKGVTKPVGWLPPDHSKMLADIAARDAVSPAFLEAMRIREERGAKYNQGSVTRKDHFPFGHVGFAQMLWIKMIRLRSEIEGYMAQPPVTKGEIEVFNARVAEHLRDNMNYEAFYWEWINGGVL